METIESINNFYLSVKSKSIDRHWKTPIKNMDLALIKQLAAQMRVKPQVYTGESNEACKSLMRMAQNSAYALCIHQLLHCKGIAMEDFHDTITTDQGDPNENRCRVVAEYILYHEQRRLLLAEQKIKRKKKRQKTKP